MTIVPAEGAILDRILSATFEIWHEGLARAAYPRYYTGQLATAWGRANLRRWALVDRGEVLASVKTYAFDAVLDGRDIRAIGYGAVFTQPAHRGAGYARTLLDEMLQRAAADGCDAALLFSEIGAPYYERLGFAAIPTFDVTLRVREDARRGAPATLVRFGDDRDLADVASMGETRGAPFRFRLRRTRELVQYALTKRRLLAGLSAPGERAVQFFVAEEGGSAAAYVVVSTRGSTWTVEEAGDRDPAGARVGAILQALIARDPAERRPQIVAWLPGNLRPPQVDILADQPARDAMMIKPLTPAGTPVPPLTRGDVFYWRADLF
ncbi:MAG TPA: GNAT family N-acetyltransferase [Vicinamibacterales bacterium]|nr:GNAT family N-acetyltransferase [Vicinamibacterales bacterium]